MLHIYPLTLLARNLKLHRCYVFLENKSLRLCQSCIFSNIQEKSIKNKYEQTEKLLT
jgi:hypothetical protein